MKRVMWLLLSVAASTGCGDDGNNRKILDAPAVLQDVPETGDAAVSPVTVTVTGDGTPTQNIEVYFQNADSSLVATAMTDATGTASHVMVAGGYVTVLDPNPLPAGVVAGGTASNSHSLYTWAGVKPGDHLKFDSGEPSVTMSTHTITIPLDSQHGATQYAIFTTCNGFATNVSAPNGTAVSTVQASLQLFGCGATTDFMVVGEDVDGNNVSWFYKPAVALTDADTHDFGASTYAATTDRTIEFDNNPSVDNGIDITDSFIRANTVFSAQTAPGGDGDATVTATISEPMFPAMTLDVITSAQTINMTSRNTLYWGPTAGAYQVDYGGMLIGDFTTAPSFDTGTQTIGWTLGTGKPADFALTEVFANNGTASWDWSFAGPNATSAHLPTLPTDVMDFTITAADNPGVQFTAVAIAPGGYDGFRPTAFDGPPQPVGATGTATYNQYQQPDVVASDTHLPSSFLKIKQRFAKPVRHAAKHSVWRKR